MLRLQGAKGGSFGNRIAPRRTQLCKLTRLEAAPGLRCAFLVRKTYAFHQILKRSRGGESLFKEGLLPCPGGAPGPDHQNASEVSRRPQEPVSLLVEKPYIDSLDEEAEEKREGEKWGGGRRAGRENLKQASQHGALRGA